jgi:hypothetical protein
MYRKDGRWGVMSITSTTLAPTVHHTWEVDASVECSFLTVQLAGSVEGPARRSGEGRLDNVPEYLYAPLMC